MPWPGADTMPRTTPRARDAVRRAFALMMTAAPWVAGVVLAGGVLLRLTVRDAVPVVAAWFYATPPAVLAGLALAGVAWSLVRRRRRVGVLLGIVAIIYGLEWRASAFLTQSGTPAPTTAAAPGPRVLFWNVCQGYLGWDGVRAAIRAQDADVIGLVEVTGEPGPTLARWRTEFPGYATTALEGHILVLVRGSIERSEFVDLPDSSRYRCADVIVGGRPLRVTVIDVASNPLRSRAPVLRTLTDLAARSRGRRLLLMGDFNTPTDSVHLAGLRAELDNAFERHGEGYACTWPLPLPVLPLDQVWVGRDVAVTRCEIGWTVRSDHRPVLLELDGRR